MTIGPQVSAPLGTVRNCFTWPRWGPHDRDVEEADVGSESSAIGSEPEFSVFVERDVVRAGDLADVVLVEAGEVDRGVLGVAAGQHEAPGE
ncbi:hypothetical protein QFZ68_005476 [Streptomyces sp. V1I6]|nr:hypothetical protein [Streptomyces sp. V1I6]